MSPTALAIRRPVTVLMLFVSLALVGVIAAFRLPLEFLPSFDAPLAVIDIPYPGSTPEEVERSITRPVEEVLATIPGIERLSAFSRADGSQVIVWFRLGQDLGTKAIEARDRVEAIRAELPQDVQRINVFKWSTTDAPVLNVRVSSQRDLSGAYDLLDRKIKRPLERLPGVARVNLQGVEPRELRIELLPERIDAHGIALNALLARLSAANFSVSAGMIDDGPERLRVQPVGEFRSLDELRNFPVNEQGLRLADIAEIGIASRERRIWRYLDGRPAIGIEIFREQNANLVEVGSAALAAIRAMNADPELEGIELYLISNQAENVTSSLREVTLAGLVGMGFSLIVLVAFLRHGPSTLMVAMAVPLCIAIALGALYAMGLSLNILTLMGLLLGVGMLVDNAVVVVESIHQQRERRPGDPQGAALEGTRAVGLAVSAGTLTSIIVFAPNLFGQASQVSTFLTQVAAAITVSLLASWAVAVTLIPMLASRLATPPPRPAGWIEALRERYGQLLEWTLRHRSVTVLGTLGLALVSILGPMRWTPVDFFPPSESGEIRILYEPIGQYRPETIRAGVQSVEDWLRSRQDELGIASIYSWFDERGAGSTNVVLREPSQLPLPIATIRERIREGLPQLAQARLSLDRQRRGGSEGVQLTLVGESSELLREYAEQALRLLEGVEGLSELSHSLSGSAGRELQVRVDRERASEYGFSAREVAELIGTGLRGAPLREYRGAEGELPIWLQLKGSREASVDVLAALRLQRPVGEPVPLLSLVRLEQRDGPRQLVRQDRETAITISANLEGRTLDEARADIHARMQLLALPPGYQWRFGGVFQQDIQAQARMLFNTLLAIVLIYIVMAALFESLLYPASIMSALVFSVFGVYWFFWLTGTTFSIMASIGILVLIGVVVNNGIVMVEHINALRREGRPRLEAIVAGARERLRPILMTVGTTVLGLLPLCFSSTQVGGDGPPYYPMARAIVGGLLFSTLVSLVVLPTVYLLLDDLRWASRALLRQALAAPQPRADLSRS